MPQIQIECDECKKKFWTPVTKVYVFKQRYCNKCKPPQKLKVRGENLVCPKCGAKWKLDNHNAVAALRVEIVGTTRDFLLADKKRRSGIETEKILVPKKRLCQRCRNFKNMIVNAIRAEQKKAGVKELTDEQVKSMMVREMQQLLRKQFREMRRKEIMKKQQKEMEKEIRNKQERNKRSKVERNE